MTNKDFDQPEDGDEVLGAEGSEAQASGPEPHQDTPDGDDALTVEDILDAPQTDDAAVADAPEEEHDLLLDLKRVQAEYANYRRRTEEQRHVEIARAKGSVVSGLLPVLDDFDRAEKHGDLAEGSALTVIAEKVRGIVTRMGVERYGATGDAFDPQQHEAIVQVPTPGATDTTILEVVEIGYRLGDIELRPAKVVVAVPAD